MCDQPYVRFLIRVVPSDIKLQKILILYYGRKNTRDPLVRHSTSLVVGFFSFWFKTWKVLEYNRDISKY